MVICVIHITLANVMILDMARAQIQANLKNSKKKEDIIRELSHFRKTFILV